MDVRRLAAIDMHGLHGTLFRRRIILAEFLLGAAGGIAIGVLILLSSPSAGFAVLAVWVVGVGINYVPLALYALAFYRPGALEAELAGADVRAELRHYTASQFWIAVPLLFPVLAAAQLGRDQ